ncbi:hypothetical protein EH223_16480 [candidate division KSB1 bacterium]|nr:aryl-sulfate sulfotransferase [candidate division KSB1 bacterium]RQW01025.1 MAG: hypothetical protein EH223_16480 [candidate division KSB1 bacterium]
MFFRFFLLFIIASVCFAGPYHPAIEYIFPLPNSELLPAKATVILRLEGDLYTQIDDLKAFISVKENGANRAGQVFFSTDERTIIFKPTRDLSRGEKIDVFIQTSQVGFSDFSFSFSTWADTPNFQIPHDEPETASIEKNYFKKVKANGIRLINGVAVPSDFPAIETHLYGETAAGDIFFGTNFTNDGIGNYVVICNNEGTPLFYRRFDNAGNSCANFVVQPSEHFSAYLFSPDQHVVLDKNFDVVEIVKPGHGYHGDDHEFIILENGHILLTCEEWVPIDMSKIINGGQRNASVHGNMFQELDRERNVIFEWRSWDHFDLLDNQVENLNNRNIDYVHLNSIAFDYDGHYVISSKHLHEITKIDSKTGEIIWRFGGRNNQFDMINDDIPFTLQHTLRPVLGKPNQYTMFDNGGARNPNYARAVQYKLDPVAKTAEKVWEYRYSPDRRSGMMGGTQRLPNGNTYIDWSTTPPMKACEVTPDGRLLFDIYVHGASTYRSHRLEWEGKSRVPYFILENYGETVNLIFNKFADESVDYYKIYHATSPHPTSVLDTTSQTFYQAFFLENNKRHYFRITAVDVNGLESDFSEELDTFLQFTPAGENMIKNGEFNSKAGWNVEKKNGAAGVGLISPDNEFLLRIQNPGILPADFQVYQESLILMNNKTYQLEFDAYAESTRPMQVYLGKNSSPFTDYAHISTVALSKNKKHYSYSFKMQHTNDTQAKLSFYCGQFDGDVYLDNISLKYITTIIDNHDEPIGPKFFTLHQNYPNPFNPATTLQYEIPEMCHVKLIVYNVLGEMIETVVDEFHAVGAYQRQFAAKDLSAGIYFYQLRARTLDGKELTSEVHKMMLVK